MTNNKLEIITYATHNENYFSILIKSAKRNNLKLTVLGYGNMWVDFTDKLTEFLKYLKNKDPGLIVMFVDGFDVIINNTTEHEILNKYYSFNKPIVFSIENFNSFTFPICYSKIANTGAYMGRVEELRELLTDIMQYNIKMNMRDDQLLLNHYLKYTEKHGYYEKHIAMDLRNEIFWNVPDVVTALTALYNPFDYIKKTYYYKDNKIKIKNNDNSPAIIQANGSTDISYIIKDLNYDISGVKDAVTYYKFKITQVFNIMLNSRYYNNNNILLYDFIMLLTSCFIVYNVYLLTINKMVLFSILLISWCIFTICVRW